MLRHISITLLVALCVPAPLLACPMVSGLPDFNCDGEIHVTVVGDSLVHGTEDTENNGKGGYVLRAQRSLRGVTVHSFGFPGITTRVLTSRVDRAFSKKGGNRLAQALVQSDLIVIDVGRNDEWSNSVQQTADDLKKLRQQIEDDVSSVTEHKPLVVTAVLMITRTIKKGVWISQLNRYIASSSSKSAPADLRFDSVHWRLCGEDRIHPTSKGYERLARIFVRYITHSYPEHASELRRDKDMDGLYDVFERSRFGTDPRKADTDRDGLLDGEDPDPLHP